MRLADFLAPERVVVPLRAGSVEAAILELARACTASGAVTDPEQLEQLIGSAWEKTTIGLSPVACLPHFRTRSVSNIVAALGVAPAPLKGLGGEIRLVVLVMAPPREAAIYLQTVAAFARSLARPDAVQAILAAPDSAAVLALPAFTDVKLEGQLLVRHLMTTRVVSVRPETPLGDAARLLLQHQVEALPVVGDTGVVLGMISNRELLRFLVPAYVQRVNTGEFRAARRSGDPKPADPRQLPVKEAMWRNVLCLSEDQPIADVAQLLANKDVDRFPVTRDGVLCGFLTRADIVRKIIGTT